ncbi:MAG: cell division protein [Gammaproteobacteria bacterium]|nr:cell division protein [Gammaproteobacteria bacterium]|tara:strand:- start:890 stop:1855 length:966 start_codon:yes stop_codon:yes gene_type:complete
MGIREEKGSRIPFHSSGLFNIWLIKHISASLGALGRMSRQPFASFMIILVIGVTLALPATISIVIKNTQSMSDNWDDTINFSVYLKKNISIKNAEEVAKLISQRADIENVKIITADEALLEFKNQSGFGDALDQLDVNPLPHTIVIDPSPKSTSTSLFFLHEEIRNLPEIDIVQADTDWIKRFHAILNIVRKSIDIGTILLGIAIVVIIGNTIRLDIENRREEIEIAKLIGADNAFIYRPFLWIGFWYGLFGGIFSSLLLQYGIYLLKDPISRLANLYQGEIFLTSYSMAENVIIVGLAISLGIFTSWATTARYMRQIEPR